MYWATFVEEQLFWLIGVSWYCFKFPHAAEKSALPSITWGISVVIFVETVRPKCFHRIKKGVKTFLNNFSMPRKLSWQTYRKNLES